ncbi:MAG: L,D-transpeptidase family protein [Dysgonamonadaceae bacterium]|jgi:murein L,D-transpeptidase YafK|nr:L,D-transpeptidase family protein [Dysgonamonadaceae bacterium]
MNLKSVLIIILQAVCFTLPAQTTFLQQQKSYSRVRTAIAEKEKAVKENLRKNRLTPDSVHILITVFKSEKQLEIYAKNKTDSTCSKIASYNICRSSGKLGPKRKEGDGQVPEGFYHIDRFNPFSNFYLSLGINYPNLSDRKKSHAEKLGGDIFIHGSCVTIGCLPMTDNVIKEIYLYAVLARNNGQSKIPVYIFPFRMTDVNFNAYQQKYKANEELIAFWTNLKTGYDKFEKEKRTLNVSVNKNGDYVF